MSPLPLLTPRRARSRANKDRHFWGLRRVAGAVQARPVPSRVPRTRLRAALLLCAGTALLPAAAAYSQPARGAASPGTPGVQVVTGVIQPVFGLGAKDASRSSKRTGVTIRREKRGNRIVVTASPS
jgi:hypothetical protein